MGRAGEHGDLLEGTVKVGVQRTSNSERPWLVKHFLLCFPFLPTGHMETRDPPTPHCPVTTMYAGHEEAPSHMDSSLGEQLEEGRAGWPGPCSPHPTCIWGLWSKHNFTQRHVPCLLGYLRDHAELGVMAFLQTPFPAPLESDILVPGSALPARLLLPEPLRPPVPHVLAGLCPVLPQFPWN